MKNKLTAWVAVTLITSVVLAVTGCTSTTRTKITAENQGEFGKHVRTPVKDFVSMGFVFTETMLTNSSKSEGQIFTYQALLKEAHKLGADALINVVIDKKTEMVTSSDFGFGSGTQETWYGSALAIKYTDILRETVTVNGVTTTSVYFNEDTTVNTGRQNDDAPAKTDKQETSSALRGIRQ